MTWKKKEKKNIYILNLKRMHYEKVYEKFF